MLKYRWFAKAYGWTPAQVDDLWEDEDYWLPVLEAAWAEVDRLAAAEAQQQQRGAVSMATFAEAAAYLDVIARRAEDAAEPVAVAMAEAFTDHVSKVTLRQYAHDRWSKTPAPRGGPPAMVDGHLADSFIVIPGGSAGGVGRAIAGNTAVYAAVQQWGRVITVKTRRFLMWKTSYPTSVTNFEKSGREGDGLFLNFAKSVYIPARPYFDVKDAIPEIEEKKIAVFMALVWGG